MKLIVGLGNPRINISSRPITPGFSPSTASPTIESRSETAPVATAKVIAAMVLDKPETFMNLSGQAVQELVAKLEIRSEVDLIVIYDELDLPMGTIRIRQRGSSAGHNGMKSIIGAMGTQEFARIRIGIAPEEKILKPFRKRQLKQVDEMLDTAAEAVKVILTDGIAVAMNRFNRKPEEEASSR